MPVQESLVLILDEDLLSKLDLSGWPIEPDLLETGVTIISAPQPSRVLCESEPHISISVPQRVDDQQPGHVLMPAFERYASLRTECVERYRDLLIIATSSKNHDSSLAQAVEWLKAKKLRIFGITLIDVGGVLYAAEPSTIEKHVDLLVTHEGKVLCQDDLVSLWQWIPQCLSGFQTFVHEGHHPNEPTWLSMPPDPFSGIDFAQIRKDKVFGR